MRKTEKTDQHWAVPEFVIEPMGYKNKSLIRAVSGSEVRYYQLFHMDVQRQILSELMKVTNLEEAHNFTLEWGFLVDANAMPLQVISDAAASIRWIYELLEQLEESAQKSKHYL